MSDPVLIPCAKDDWTKVATNVVNGRIHKKSNLPHTYLSVYRDTGNVAPTSRLEGVAIFVDNNTEESIFASAGVDVYIFPVKAAGNVRVDL